MRIAWFTPFIKGSAIARASHGITLELAKLCEVHICHFGGGEILKTDVPLKSFRSDSDVTLQSLSHYDLVFYNMGNYLPYHHEIFRVSQRVPGVMILHDFVMHNFFASHYLEQLRDPAGYVLLMSRNYGDAGALIAHNTVSGQRRGVWESDEVASYPAFEDTARAALGVVTHSTFFRKKVEEVFAGPVKRIPLAYECDPAGTMSSRAELGIDPSEVLIVTVGHVNPNKRVDSVIEALHELGALSERFLYAVLGPCSPEYSAMLRSIAESGKLSGSVRFCGAVSDEVLRSYLHHADFCVNLRYPATEGASASVIEEMLFGKPVIVNDVGFFAELPGHCVIKVNPTRRSELHTALRRLITEPALRQKLGQAAKEYATMEHRSDRYAKEILAFATEVGRSRLLLQLCDVVASELKSMGVSRHASTVDSVSGHLEKLFLTGT